MGTCLGQVHYNSLPYCSSLSYALYLTDILLKSEPTGQMNGKHKQRIKLSSPVHVEDVGKGKMGATMILGWSAKVYSSLTWHF